jgi:hypothetical protein
LLALLADVPQHKHKHRVVVSQTVLLLLTGWWCCCCCRHEDPSKCTSEDDGYLITYVHDESVSDVTNSSSSSSGSSLVVWDAATMSQQPLAVVALPQRVPYGFHALWVSEGQFQQQLQSQPLLPTSLAN